MRIAVFQSHPIQHFVPLWRELARQPGVQLRVFYYSRQGVEPGLDREFNVAMAWDLDLLTGYHYEFLPRHWTTRNHLDCSWKGVNRNIGAALAWKPDVAYVCGYIHLNNWNVVLRCKRRRIAVLYQSDSNFLADRKRPVWRHSLKRIVVGTFFRRVAVFLACGDHNRAYLEHYGAPPNQIRYSPIPVDAARFRAVAGGMDAAERRALRERQGLGRDDFVAGFCGKLVSHKRPADLIKAVERAERAGMTAFYIGSGPLEPVLRKRGGPARFAGFVNQSQIPRMLALCNVLVLPSERDAHPLVVTEAQCLGLPVVLSDACGCYGPNDVFTDGESGILYPCGDVGTLAQALAWLADHPEECRRMGRRAATLAETQSVRVTADKFLQAARDAVSLA
jgi:glycosyltransferase involved in cell wall biosynthesis